MGLRVQEVFPHCLVSQHSLHPAGEDGELISWKLDSRFLVGEYLRLAHARSNCCHLVYLEEGVNSLTPRPYHVVKPAWVSLTGEESPLAPSRQLSLKQLEVLH